MSKVIVADPHGFCFGVQRAIDLATDIAKSSKKAIFLLGELVHNQHVIDWLESELKIKTVQSLEDIPSDSIVVIRAHGVSPEIFLQAKKRGLEIVDASCPLVLKSHQSVKDLSSQKKDIIFLCNKVDHDETVGVVGEAPQSVTPIPLKEVSELKIKDSKNTVVLTQTTLSTLETEKAFKFLKQSFPQITILPHICQATTDRQNIIIKLAKKHKFVIIVGSPTSANSNSLKQVAEISGATAYIIDNESELKDNWFEGIEDVVISSGASTPESILDKVIKKINQIIHQ